MESEVTLADRVSSVVGGGLNVDRIGFRLVLSYRGRATAAWMDVGACTVSRRHLELVQRTCGDALIDGTADQ